MKWIMERYGNSRSGVFLGVPLASPHVAFASLPQVVRFLEIDLSNLFLSVGSLSEAATFREVDDSLCKRLDGNYRVVSSNGFGPCYE